MRKIQKTVKVSQVETLARFNAAANAQKDFDMIDAIMSAESNAADTFIEMGRKQDIGSYDPDIREEFATIAIGSIAFTSSFDKPHVRDFFAALGYKW